jgi:hypothetical protein
LQECRQLKLEWKTPQTNGLTLTAAPNLTESLGLQQ